MKTSLKHTLSAFNARCRSAQIVAYGFGAFALSLLLGGTAHATDAAITVASGVDVDGTMTNLRAGLSPAIVGYLGIVAMFAVVYFIARMLKKGARG